MNPSSTGQTRVVLYLDDEVIAALDRARADERLSRSSYVRAVTVRQLRKSNLIASASPEAIR